MKNAIGLVVSVLVFVLVGSQAFGATFTSPTQGFAVDYDAETWEVAPDKPKGSTTGQAEGHEAGTTLLNLQRKQADDKYHSRFSVVVEPVGKNAKTLEEYQERSLNFLKNQRFQNPTSQPVKLPNLSEKAYELVGYQRDFGLTFIQVIFERGQDFYLLTAAARMKQFDAQKAELRKILDSFRFQTAQPKS